MRKEINILILSCGTRNKIVQYFKKALKDKGKVMATDCSELAPALYDADQYFVVPKIEEKGYLEIILKICEQNKITAILSLIDPELNLLARNKERFLALGVIPIVSDYEVVEKCFDKFCFYKFLIENDFKTVRSYIDKDAFYNDVDKGVVDYPVFVKPVKGSASINISKIESKEEIKMLFSRNENLMIQEYMDGIEYGVDVYIDMLSKEVASIFIKQKLKMRAGETDKSISIKDSKMFNLIKTFVEKIGFIGSIDIDIFRIDNEYYISEVNPRFGGGYPHAYECGCNHMELIVENLLGRSNEKNIGSYDDGICMMKYNDVVIKKL